MAGVDRWKWGPRPEAQALLGAPCCGSWWDLASISCSIDQPAPEDCCWPWPLAGPEDPRHPRISVRITKTHLRTERPVSRVASRASSLLGTTVDTGLARPRKALPALPGLLRPRGRGCLRAPRPGAVEALGLIWVLLTWVVATGSCPLWLVPSHTA